MRYSWQSWWLNTCEVSNTPKYKQISVCLLKLLALSALLLINSAVYALGLGEIRVKSRPGEPFLAEIPIIANDPSEMENLNAKLASVDTFSRVGLPAPTGVVRDLQFAVTQNAQNQAVIQVSSGMPVVDDSLSFLVQVEWAQGRLVREYTALTNAPNIAESLIEAPQIEAPLVNGSNTIVREPTTPPASNILTDPSTVNSNAGQDTNGTENSLAAETPVPPKPKKRNRPAAPAIPRDGKAWRVQAGQTLSEIALQVRAGSNASLNQTMLALLRANPEAFIGGNINLVRAGASLTLPPASELSQLDRASADALVIEQTNQWRNRSISNTPIPIQNTPVQNTAATTAASSTPSTPANTNTSTPSTATSAAGSGGGTGARLEIAPVVTSTTPTTDARTGATANGKGNVMDSEELRQTKENLAAREAELVDLKTRLEELEKIRADQEKLIELKDSELANAQKNLTEVNKPAPEAPVAAQEPPQVTETQPSEPLPTDEPDPLYQELMDWALPAGLLIAAIILVVFLLKRRKPKALPSIEDVFPDLPSFDVGSGEETPSFDEEPPPPPEPKRTSRLSRKPKNQGSEDASSAGSEPVIPEIPSSNSNIDKDSAFKPSSSLSKKPDLPSNLDDLLSSSSSIPLNNADDIIPSAPPRKPLSSPPSGMPPIPDKSDDFSFDMPDNSSMESAEISEIPPELAHLYFSQDKAPTPPPVDQDNLSIGKEFKGIPPLAIDNLPDDVLKDAMELGEISPETPLPREHSGRDRLDLANAYVEIGDFDTARTLLRSVIAAGDEIARNEAMRMLRQLNQ